ncbi:oligoendopeptidase F [Planococcus donghaensis MPA1U2]|uniref:Oligoendopeptidase F n=1 Tax=Planococcus donghaensis MPA1U2 TaxID=933115 RepID=E7RD91_9BACL|nr:M3 family oligoendopeptidase [Planococcus donghaensis]EGA91041.1 oligoendopeptidase F [Planococcus donghaensis MPA1U2]
MNQLVVQNWNLNSLYKGGSQSIQLAKLISRIVEQLYIVNDEISVHKIAIRKQNLQPLLSIVQQFQLILSEWEEVDEFLLCAYSENVNNSSAISLIEKSDSLKVEIDTLKVKVNQLLASLPEDVWHEFIQLEEIQPITFYLEKQKKEVCDRLPAEMERLISVMSVNGIKGWEQQQQFMLSKLKVLLEVDGYRESVSIGQALNYAIHSKDDTLRKRAAQGIKEVCEAEAASFAAVFNHIAGSRLDIYEQRGWTNLLKEAIEQNDIKEETIHLAIASIDQNKKSYLTYIQRKLELSRTERASWFDLVTPLFAPVEKISYNEAREIILTQFYRFSEKLGRFAEIAFESDWIESENRPNKAESGFCTSLPISKESRIFFTYRETYQDVLTLAHELGHAYHNFIIHEEPALAQQTGISVAETASTFMENLVLDAVIGQTTNEQDKLALLEMKIKNGLMYVGAVPNMFRFEQAFYEKRKEGPLSVQEINELLSGVENSFYEGQIEDLAIYKWIYTSHFYDAEKPFYNIPYTIGYLFSNGIYEMANIAPTGFEERYDELLRNSGRMTVEQLAQTFLDVDISKREFWHASQQPLKDAIDEYMRLTEKYCVLD